jgi:hypothetical protein
MKSVALSAVRKQPNSAADRGAKSSQQPPHFIQAPDGPVPDRDITSFGTIGRDLRRPLLLGDHDDDDKARPYRAVTPSAPA